MNLEPYLSVRLGSWRPIEHVFLGGAIQIVTTGKHPVNWTRVSQLLKGSRTAEQCRLRWEYIKKLRLHATVTQDTDFLEDDEWREAVFRMYRQLVILIYAFLH